MDETIKQLVDVVRASTPFLSEHGSEDGVLFTFTVDDLAAYLRRNPELVGLLKTRNADDVAQNILRALTGLSCVETIVDSISDTVFTPLMEQPDAGPKEHYGRIARRCPVQLP